MMPMTPATADSADATAHESHRPDGSALPSSDPDAQQLANTQERQDTPTRRHSDADAGRATAPEPRRLMPRALTVLLALAAAWLALQGMQQLQSLIVPVFLALNLMIAAYPVGRAITRLGLPPIIGSLITMLIVLAIMIGVFVAIGWALAQLIADLPNYSNQFNDLVQKGVRILERWGVQQDQINTWLKNFNLTSMLGVLSQLLNSFTAVGGLLAAAFATIVFFGIDAAGLPRRLSIIARDHARVHDALLDFALSVRAYWLVTAIFGAIVATVEGFVLMALGVPLAWVWAVLWFVCNFIPNIGFIFAMIPPVLLALLAKGPITALIFLAIVIVMAMVVQGVIQPKVTGHAVGVTASVSFLSVLFWSWVLGLAGALLAVPMTLLVKELLVDADPRARWMNALLADDPDEAVDTPGSRVEAHGGDAATR